MVAYACALVASDLSLDQGMRPSLVSGDGGLSCKPLMGMFAPGHFSINPDDHEGREMVTTVRSDHAGEELNVTFKATISMEMSAFEKLAKKKFKGVYWLSEEPVTKED